MPRGRMPLVQPERDDPARGLHVLQNKALVATANARTDAEVLQVQRDIVEGARRLVGWLTDMPPSPRRNAALAAAHAYQLAAQQALVRLERRRELSGG